MNNEDEAFLTEVHRNLDKQAIGPTSPHYVALEELPGQVLGLDPVPMLATRVRRATTGSTFFLTGLRGSGKSSQLLRFKQQLERDGFPVLMVDAEDYLNLRRPLGVTDMLFFLVGAISDQAVAYGLLGKSDAADSFGWSRLREWLGRYRLAPGVELGVKLPPVEGKISLRAELRDNPSFVTQLRDFLDGRVGELVAQAHSIIEAMVDEMRKRWTRGEWKDLVVIVDSLDHNRALEAATFLEVRRALVNLFDLDKAKLELPRCRTIFTLPSLVTANEGGVVRRVTNVKVIDQHGKPNNHGIDALRAVLAKRIPGGLERIFPDDDAVARLAVASGGNLRMLLSLAMEVITQAETLPVDEATLLSSIGEVRNSLLPLSDDERSRLRRVAATHDLPLDSPECWEPVAELLDRRLVLGYRNGDVWYDVHPLVANEIGDDRAVR